jgi:hypothetical protein
VYCYCEHTVRSDWVSMGAQVGARLASAVWFPAPVRTASGIHYWWLLRALAVLFLFVFIGCRAGGAWRVSPQTPVLSRGAASAQTAAQKLVECCFERDVCVLKMLVRAHSETCASCFLGGAFQPRCAVSQRLSKRLKAKTQGA